MPWLTVLKCGLDQVRLKQCIPYDIAALSFLVQMIDELGDEYYAMVSSLARKSLDWSYCHLVDILDKVAEPYRDYTLSNFKALFKGTLRINKIFGLVVASMQEAPLALRDEAIRKLSQYKTEARIRLRNPYSSQRANQVTHYAP